VNDHPGESERVAGRRLSVGTGEPQRIAVRGLPLAVDVLGDGLPLLLVHGFPLDRTVWREVVAALTGWRRIVPDLRGMGLSEVTPHYSMAEYADDLAALLDTLGVPQAIVCGLSMGGYVAFELLRRHRDRVRALVLMNTRAEPDDAAGRRARDDMVALVEREGPGAVADVMVPQLLAPANLSAMPHVVGRLRGMITANPAAGIIGALHAMRDRPDSRPLLPGITIPTLVVAGRDDRLIPPSASHALADAIPGAQLTRIAHAGHLAPLEQPVATSRVIAEFLESLE
jgi:3-oxoadipate enol-lactonase